MADYISAPQVLDSNTILLYGNYYRIEGPVGISLSSPAPQRKQFTWSDFTGGFGLQRYTTPLTPGQLAM